MRPVSMFAKGPGSGIEQGGRRLTGRVAALLAHPGPWTLPRIRRYLRRVAGQPTDAVPAGPAGGDLAAAQADRPR
jgi:hypothetical protein